MTQDRLAQQDVSSTTASTGSQDAVVSWSEDPVRTMLRTLHDDTEPHLNIDNIKSAFTGSLSSESVGALLLRRRLGR